MNLRQKMAMFFATGCFVGKIPFAPGTFGSIAGLPLCYFFSQIQLSIAIICIITLILFSIWVSHEAERRIKEKDPGCIVIDEIAGLVVTFAGLPFTLSNIAAGFLIFRFLDILKPFPIRYLEKKLKGGAGIVADDVAAGIIGNVILRVVGCIGGG